MRFILRILIFAVFFFPLIVSAERGSLEIRAGYFLPQDKLMRKVYNNGGMEAEIEGAYRIVKELRTWVNISAFYKKGFSEGLDTPTSIQVYPLSIGFKYSFNLFKSAFLYLGVGPSNSWVIICDHSSYVKQRIVKNGWGITTKSGLSYYFSKHVLLDVFADYSYTKISPISYQGVQSQSLNIGGLRTGMALGVYF